MHAIDAHLPMIGAGSTSIDHGAVAAGAEPDRSHRSGLSMHDCAQPCGGSEHSMGAMDCVIAVTVITLSVDAHPIDVAAAAPIRTLSQDRAPTVPTCVAPHSSPSLHELSISRT
jgi:hypothetical protein